MSTPAARYVRGSIHFLLLKHPELGTCLGSDADLVVAGEARVTELRGVATRRLQHAFQREIADRIGADVAPDLLDGVAGADQLLPRRRVDAVIAGPLDRRGRRPHVGLFCARTPDHPPQPSAGRPPPPPGGAGDHPPALPPHAPPGVV